VLCVHVHASRNDSHTASHNDSHEKLSWHCCAMVCSSMTAWPQAALISFQSTGNSGVRPSLKPLMVPNGPSCQILKVSLRTLVDWRDSSRGAGGQVGVRGKEGGDWSSSR